MASKPHGDERAAETARERMAEVLKAALEPVEDAPIDDATRRLMLHLSIEPVPAPTAPPPQERDKGAPSMLRRLFLHKRRGRNGAAGKSGDA